ncbi:MAG: nucleoside-diphosphate kinase [Patescibacteria group bacterium]
MANKNEHSYVMVKPDGVQRSLIGEIIRRFERTGLKLVALKLVLPTEDQCWTHYNKDDAWFETKGVKMVESRKLAGLPTDRAPIEYGKDIVRALVKFMTSGPVVAMIWQGNEAVGIVKKLVGGTEPLTSDVGTIRGDMTLDSYDLSGADERAVRNLIHCSDKPEEAEREIAIWFKPEEIIKYRLLAEEILYDVNLDGILE